MFQIVPHEIEVFMTFRREILDGFINFISDVIQKSLTFWGLQGLQRV